MWHDFQGSFQQFEGIFTIQKLKTACSTLFPPVLNKGRGRTAALKAGIYFLFFGHISQCISERLMADVSAVNSFNAL